MPPICNANWVRENPWVEAIVCETRFCLYTKSQIERLRCTIIQINSNNGSCLCLWWSSLYKIVFIGGSNSFINDLNIRWEVRLSSYLFGDIGEDTIKEYLRCSSSWAKVEIYWVCVLNPLKRTKLKGWWSWGLIQAHASLKI